MGKKKKTPHLSSALEFEIRKYRKVKFLSLLTQCVGSKPGSRLGSGSQSSFSGLLCRSMDQNAASGDVLPEPGTGIRAKILNFCGPPFPCLQMGITVIPTPKGGCED